MDDAQRAIIIEALARIAVQSAGYDPDHILQVTAGNSLIFEDVAWRCPTYLKKAEAAYSILDGPTLSTYDSGSTGTRGPLDLPVRTTDPS